MYPPDPLTIVLNGQPASFVPVAQAYENLGPLQFRRMELRWQYWQRHLQAARTDRLEVDYPTYLALECALHAEILDHVYPPPAWLALPNHQTDVAGCSVIQRDGELFWVAADGTETWLPPHRDAYQASLVAEKTHPYAHLWDHEGVVEKLTEVTARTNAYTDSAAEPTPEAVRASAASRRFDVARYIWERYHHSPPLYLYDSTPYNRLLGLVGFTGMMTALLDHPALVHRYLEAVYPTPTLEMSAAFAFGVGIVFIEECLASADLISPELYLEFSFPYTKRLLEFYEARGFRTVLYFSGNLMPFLPYLNQLPFTALSFEENRKQYGIDLAEVRRALPNKVLFGNVDAAFLERASDAEVMTEVRRQVTVAGREGKYVLSAGSPFTPGTSLARVRFFCESTQRL